MAKQSDTPRAGRKLLAVAFLGWLGWGSVRGASGMLAELARDPQHLCEAFTLSLAERRARTLAKDDRQDGLPEGTLEALTAALLEHVPAHATVQLVGMRERKEARPLAAVAHLVFPRRLATDLVPLPAGWEPPEGEFLLVFRADLDARLAPRKSRLAGGPQWSLWR